MIDPAKLNPVPWIMARINERSTLLAIFSAVGVGAAAASALTAPWSYFAFASPLLIAIVSDGKVKS